MKQLLEKGKISGIKVKRALRILVIHILTAVVLIWVWRCPFYFLFGIPCPGCGITRACLALLGGSVAEAFYWNPMFLPAGAAFLYAIHREKIPVRPGRRTEMICAAVLVAGMTICYIYRVVLGHGPITADPENGLLFRLFETLRGGEL